MFKHIIIVVAGIAICFLLTQCQKADDASPKPNGTKDNEAALNTIMATIDGTQRNFKTAQLLPTRPLIITSKLAFRYFEKSTGLNAIEMTATVGPVTGRGNEYMMSIKLKSIKETLQRFDVTPTQGNIYSKSYFSYTEALNGKVVSEFVPVSGIIEITKYENNVIEGVFSGVLRYRNLVTGGIDSSKPSIDLKNGFFKAQIEDVE